LAGEPASTDSASLTDLTVSRGTSMVAQPLRPANDFLATPLDAAHFADSVRLADPAHLADAAHFADPAQLAIDPAQPFSATEFRPRKRVSTDADGAANTGYGGNNPLFRVTTVWERMGEFKSQNRLRVLTLWETQGSSVSLQAGKRGDPSLQWTSRWMNRGEATRGLLDRLFAVSLSGLGSGSRGSESRSSASASAVGKQGNSQPAAVTAAAK
jgi:hypothetical protein